LRAILNFGHTVGHAIEAATGYRRYLHGEAIAIGMITAGWLSQMILGLAPRDRIRLEALLANAGLPTRVKHPIPRGRTLQFLARDKKVRDGRVRFVLLKGLGEAVSQQAVPSDLLARTLSAVGL
jgi:3-dehydroquinate synthetase